MKRAVLAACLLAFGFSVSVVVKFSLSLDTQPVLQEVDRRVARWEAENAPPQRRVLTLVLEDALHGPDPLTVPAAASLFDFGRLLSLLRRSRPDPSAFAQALQEDPDTVVLTVGGWTGGRRQAAARAVAEAAQRAAESGGELVVIAVGEGAEAALLGAEAAEGRHAAGGKLVTLGRIVTLGMSLERLQAQDPVRFGKFRPKGAFTDWIGLWAERAGVAPSLPIVFYTRGGEGGLSDAGRLMNRQAYDRLAAGGGPQHAAELAGFARRASRREFSLAPLAAEEAADAGEGRVFRNLEGDVAAREGAPPETAQPAAPQDSLTLIRRDAQYAAQPAPPPPPPAPEPPRQAPSAPPPPPPAAPNPQDQPPPQADPLGDAMKRCCRDARGTWRQLSKEKACCQGGRWAREPASCKQLLALMAPMFGAIPSGGVGEALRCP